MTKWLAALLLVVFLVPALPPPAVRWLDERHALLAWHQAVPAELCITRLAHGNSVLLGCGAFAAGPQTLNLPPFANNDSEVWPREGDVYQVGTVRTAALGPAPTPRLVWLPAVHR